MGAWGVGMRANDTALDYIGKYQDYSGPKIKPNKLAHAIVAGKKPILKELESISRKEKGFTSDADMGILGVAEFFLELGADLKPAKKFVLAAIKRELSNARLESWGEESGGGDEREMALLRFKDRLEGKPVDKKELALDNEGLLSKMARMMRGESER